MQNAMELDAKCKMSAAGVRREPGGLTPVPDSLTSRASMSLICVLISMKCDILSFLLDGSPGTPLIRMIVVLRFSIL
jgi:hypothetical protein